MLEPAAAAKDQQITDSAIAKYLSRDPNVLDETFRCPSDPLLARPNGLNVQNATKPAYRYSYSTNKYVMSAVGRPRPISRIRNPAQKVLIVCEDEKTIDDGLYNPQPNQWEGGKVNAVAARHRVKPTKARSQANQNEVKVKLTTPTNLKLMAYGVTATGTAKHNNRDWAVRAGPVQMLVVAKKK